jgi:hypothetical protein
LSKTGPINKRNETNVVLKLLSAIHYRAKGKSPTQNPKRAFWARIFAILRFFEDLPVFSDHLFIRPENTRLILYTRLPVF